VDFISDFQQVTEYVVYNTDVGTYIQYNRSHLKQCNIWVGRTIWWHTSLLMLWR